MSRYTTHKHGLTIGYSNVFFVNESHDYTGADRHRSDYRSLVIFESYHFNPGNLVGFRIRTPAHQLVWSESKWDEDTLMGNFNISSYARNWLEANVGKRKEMWDCYSTPIDPSATDLFFRRRRDALAFIRWVQSQLEDMTIGRVPPR